MEVGNRLLNCVFRNFRKIVLIVVSQFYQVGEVVVKLFTSEHVLMVIIATTRVMVKKPTIFKVFGVWEEVMVKSVEAKTNYFVANVHGREYADLSDHGAQALLSDRMVSVHHSSAAVV